MELIDATPQYHRAKRLPWGLIRIMPLGDIQYGSAGCDLPKLKDYIAEGIRNDVYFGGMGDIHDVLSPSNRRKLVGAGFYDNASDWYEAKMQEDIEFLYEDIFKPTKGRWLWWLEGHHFWEFTDGTTTDTQLCAKLDAPFVGTCGFMKLTFIKQAENGTRSMSTSCDIWTHHGAGGTSSPGGVLTKLAKIAGGFDADLYFMGHANRLEASPFSRLEIGGLGGNLYLKNRSRRLVATGAFDKGYALGSTAGRTKRPRGGYVEQAMMIPTELGAATVSVEPVVKNTVTITGQRVNHTALEIRATV